MVSADGEVLEAFSVVDRVLYVDHDEDRQYDVVVRVLAEVQPDDGGACVVSRTPELAAKAMVDAGWPSDEVHVAGHDGFGPTDAIVHCVSPKSIQPGARYSFAVLDRANMWSLGELTDILAGMRGWDVLAVSAARIDSRGRSLVDAFPHVVCRSGVSRSGRASTRRCTRCRVGKPAGQFYIVKDKRSPNGWRLSGYCKVCHVEMAREKKDLVEVNGEMLPRQKVCSHCGETKTHEGFHVVRNVGRSPRLASQCKVCRAAYAKVYDAAKAETEAYKAQVAARSEIVHDMTLPRACTKCGAVKPPDAFYTLSVEGKPDRLTARCKTCLIDLSKARYAANK
jgi:hypothetical protein